MGELRCSLCILSNVRRKTGIPGYLKESQGNQTNIGISFLLRPEVKGELDRNAVSLRKGAEAVDPLDRAQCREIEGRGSAACLYASVGGNPVMVNVKDNGCALIHRGKWIGLRLIPVLRNFGVDDIDVVGVALSKAAVLYRDARGAVLELHCGLGDADTCGLAGNCFGGRRRNGLNVLWRRGGRLFGDFRGLDFLGDSNFFRGG